MASLGFLFGLVLAALPMYLLGLLSGLAFKSKDPDERAIYSALIAWIVIAAVAGWGFADGDSYRWDAGIMYIPAAIIVFFMLRKHYRGLWESADTDELEKTFE